MSKIPEPPRITITVSRGFVEEVYTTLPIHIEVDILDFDGAERESPEEITDMEVYIATIKQEQQKIY